MNMQMREVLRIVENKTGLKFKIVRGHERDKQAKDSSFYGVVALLPRDFDVNYFKCVIINGKAQYKFYETDGIPIEQGGYLREVKPPKNRIMFSLSDLTDLVGVGEDLDCVCLNERASAQIMKI